MAVLQTTSITGNLSTTGVFSASSDINLNRADTTPALVFTAQNGLRWIYSGGGNYWQTTLSVDSGGLLNMNNLPLATRSWVTSQGYVSGSFLPLSGGTMTGNITMNSKIVIQDGTDGGGSRGIWMWTGGDSNWGIYMGTAGASKSLANGTAPTGIDGSNSHHIRFRIAGSSGNGFIWENNSEQALMSLKGDNGNLYTRGQIYAGNSTSNLVLHAGNYSSYAVARYLTTQTGTNPVKIWNGHLASFSTNSSGNTYTIIQTSVPQDNYQMGGFTLEFFNNYSSTNGKTQIDIAGYWNPEGNGGFIGFEYHTSNPFVTPNIQVARNSSTGNVAFIITNNNVSYQVVVARDLWLGYNSSSDSAWGTGWSIYETSSIGGFTNADSVIARVAAGSDGTNASGTWGINITGNSATTSQTNFSTLTLNSATVATQSWVQSQGYLTSGSFLPLSGGTMTGDLRFNQGSGFGRIAYADNYHGMILRGIPNNAAGDVTVGDYTSLIQHSGDFRFYRTNGSINELYFQVNSTAPYWRGNVMLHAGNYTSYAPNINGGSTIGGITYFSNGESINLYGIRGRFTNEYIHLYNKVGIGHPGGWGQGEGNTPSQGLSTYGGISIAYGTNASSYVYGYLQISRNWGNGDYAAEAFTIRGTYPSITLRNTGSDSKWLIHTDSGGDLRWYWGNGVDNNNWSNVISFYESGRIDANEVRAPIFYDSDNTAYYANFADSGTSVNIAGKITTALSSGTMISHGSMSDAFGYNGSYGTYIGSVVGGTYYIYANGTFYDNGTIRTFIHSGNIGSQSVNYASSAGNADTVDGYHASSLLKLNEWNGNLYLHTDGRIYGTRFYDANNDAYYLDPDSTSRLRKVFIQHSSANSEAGPALRVSKGWDSGTPDYAYDTVIFEANDVVSIRMKESDGGTAGWSTGDGHTSFTSSTDQRFYVNGSTSGYIYSGMGGTLALSLDTSGNVNTSQTVYAGAYRGNANVGGTGQATYHPAGIYSQGTNWLYGTMYLNGNTVYDADSFQLNGRYSIWGRWNTYSAYILKVAYMTFDYNSNNGHESYHSIASTDINGSYSDCVSLNSYNDITLRLDANNNNSNSYLRISNNSAGDGTIAWIGYESGMNQNYFSGSVGISTGPRTDGYRLNMGGSIHLNGNSVDYVGSLYFSGAGHIQPNSGSYGALQMTGTRNSWAGIRFVDTEVNLMMNSNESGHYRNGYGWQFRWYNGAFYISTGGQGGGTEYIALHTGNVGSYALTETNSTFTYAASLTLSTSWQNTGVSNSNLTSNGVYVVSCSLNDFGSGGSQYSETYTGLMYWYASSTNSDNYSEISLHHMGHADNDRYIYLRTKTTPSGNGSFLQIRGNGNNSSAATYNFTFKRLL